MTNRYDLDDATYTAAFAAFQAAVAKAPGQTAFANICRCTQGNISQLLSKAALLPERFVLKVEAATGIPRNRLRPDIYPADLSSPSLLVDDASGSVGPSGRTVDFDRATLLKRASA